MSINEAAWAGGFRRVVGDESLGPTLALVLDSATKQLHICDAADSATDWGLSADSYPSVYIHDIAAPITDYVKIYHNGTNGIIDCDGTTIFAMTATTVAITADVTLTGDLALATEDISLIDDMDLEFGSATGGDTLMRWSKGDDSNHVFVIGIGDDSQQMHITDKAAIATDWGRTAGTHPELAIHSNTTPINDYLAIGNHDGTTAHINVVGGTTLSLDIGGTAEVVIAAASTSPATTNSNALGTASLMWSDLYLASGAVIYFDATDVLITHASNLLTITGGGLTMGASGTPAGDFILWPTLALAKVWLDVDGDTNGAWYFGADDVGLMVYYYGDTASYSTHWDPSGDTNGAWYFGANDYGVDVLFYGQLASTSLLWDASAGTLDLVNVGVASGDYGLSSVCTSSSAKSDGLAAYFEGHASGTSTGAVYGVGAWLNVDSGTHAYGLYGLDVGVYGGDATYSGSTYVCAASFYTHVDDSTAAPGSHYMLRFNTDTSYDTPDAWFHAANPQCIASTDNTDATGSKVSAIKIAVTGSNADPGYIWVYDSTGA